VRWRPADRCRGSPTKWCARGTRGTSTRSVRPTGTSQPWATTKSGEYSRKPQRDAPTG